MIPPCYNRETHTDCPDRSASCRSTCEKWAKYEAAHKDEIEKRYLANKEAYPNYSLARRRAIQQLLNRNKR